jgi:hypothetical protein
MGIHKRKDCWLIPYIRKMPANEIFLLEILVNGQPLDEFNPQEDDYNYPSCDNLPVSKLDRVCYVQATPGSEFTVRIKYVGDAPLSIQQAFSVSLFLDGKEVEGRLFWDDNTGRVCTFKGKRLVGDLEQAYAYDL